MMHPAVQVLLASTAMVMVHPAVQVLLASTAMVMMQPAVQVPLLLASTARYLKREGDHASQKNTNTWGSLG